MVLPAKITNQQLSMIFDKVTEPNRRFCGNGKPTNDL